MSKVLIGIKVSTEVKEQLDARKHPGQTVGGVIEELLEHVKFCGRISRVEGVVFDKLIKDQR